MRLIGVGARQTITYVAHKLAESGKKYDVDDICKAIVMQVWRSCNISGI